MLGNVRDETAYTEAIKSLAPVDHIVYSGVDKIIRGAIAEADLEDSKHYFGVKFWVGLCDDGQEYAYRHQAPVKVIRTKSKQSCIEIRHHQEGRLFDSHLGHWSDYARHHCFHRRIVERGTVHYDTWSGERVEGEENPC